jgi:hypothetical protein
MAALSQVVSATGRVILPKKITDTIATVAVTGTTLAGPTFTGLQFAFQGSADGVNFANIAATAFSTGAAQTGTISASDSTVALWRVPCEGLSAIAMNVSQLSTGSFTLQIVTESFVGVVAIPTTVAASLTSTVTSTSANALAVGPNGVTNPSFNVDASTSSAATGINIKSAAAGGGVAITGISSQGGDAITLTGTAATASTAGGAVTVAGAAGGATTGNGGAVALTGGAGTANNSIGGAASVTAGAGQGTAAGAVATLTAGASGAGATGNGGAVTVTAGAAASTNGTGGAASLIGGLGTGTGAGGAITITSGAAGSTGVAGAVNISVGGATAGVGSALTLTAGNGAGGTNGGGIINLIPGTAVSTGTPGEVQVNSAAGLFDVQYNSPLMTTVVPATGTAQPIFLATRAYRVKGCKFAVVTHGTSEAFTITKDPSGTAPGAGTALLSAPIATTVANTVVSGTLIATIATLTMAAGDRLSFLTSGTIGAAAGLSCSVLLVPV